MWPNRRSGQTFPAEIEQRLVDAVHIVYAKREKATLLAEEAVNLARSMAEPHLLASVIYQAATLLRQARRPDRAFILCLEAQPLLERFDDRWSASGVILERGLCYLAVGEHDRALELLNDAAERFDHLDDGVQLARCCTAMAEAHLLAGDLRQAVDCAARSQVALDASAGSPQLRIQLQSFEAYTRMLVGRQFAASDGKQLAQREYSRAVQALPNLADISFDSWDPGTVAALDTLIAVHIVAGNAAQAQIAMKALAKWARRWNSPIEKGLAWLRLADFRIMQNLPHQAIACARRAAKQFEKVPSELNRVVTQLILARLLEDVDDAKGAYGALCEASRINAQQQQDAVAMRAELLMLDLEAEQALNETEQTLAHAQRLSNVGHMVANINHELNQPMSSIKMMTETTIELLGLGLQQDAMESIDGLRRLSSRLVDLASKLTTFPAQSTTELPFVGVKHAINEALAMVGSRLAHTPCEVVQHIEDAQVTIAESQLVRVIANLLNNALDAMEPCARRRVVIRTKLGDAQIVIRLADSGPGIPDSARQRLFQPFFSSKAAGQGLGLGLALSRDVLREVGGDLIAVEGRGGAVFEISLGLVPTEA